MIKPFKIDLPLEVYLKNDFNKKVYNSYHLIDREKFQCEYDLKIFFDDLYSIVGTVITNYQLKFEMVDYLEKFIERKLSNNFLDDISERFRIYKFLNTLICIIDHSFMMLIVRKESVQFDSSIYTEIFNHIRKYLIDLVEVLEGVINDYTQKQNILFKTIDLYELDFFGKSSDEKMKQLTTETINLRAFINQSILSVSDYFTMHEVKYNSEKIKFEKQVLLNAEKALEEENRIKEEARIEAKEYIRKKLAERKKNNLNNDEVVKIEVRSDNNTYKSFIRTLFLENDKTIELFKYLVHNYDNPRKNSTEFTKYNHIYTLLKNEGLIYVNPNLYIKVVKELFDFDLTKGGYIKPVESNYIKDSLKPKLDHFNSIK